MEGKEGGRRWREGKQACRSKARFWTNPLVSPHPLPALLLSGLLASSRPPAPQPQAPHSIPGTFQSQLEGGQLNGESIMENSMAGP